MSRTRSCIEERPHVGLGERGPSIWHATAGPNDAAATFAPILCGVASGEGITFPGYQEQREPTCPECMALLRRHGSVTAALRDQPPASPVPGPGEGDAATTSGEQEAGPRP